MKNCGFYEESFGAVMNGAIGHFSAHQESDLQIDCLSFDRQPFILRTGLMLIQHTSVKSSLYCLETLTDLFLQLADERTGFQ